MCRPLCQRERQPLAEVGRGFRSDSIRSHQVVPPVVQRARVHPGQPLELHVFGKNGLTQLEERHRSGNPIKAWADKSRHQGDLGETLQRFEQARNGQPAVLLADGLGHLV